MTELEWKSIFCPQCSEVITEPEDGADAAVCSACGQTILFRGHLCPSCFAFHDEERAICARCGESLTVNCPHCHTANWAGVENCQKCLQRMDLVERIVALRSPEASARLNRQMQQATELRELEELSSGRRMDELMSIEARRQELFKQRLARQREQDRRLLIAVAIAVAFFAVVLLAYAVFSILR